MFSVKQSVKELMWAKAAEACASALSILTRSEQLSIAQKFLEHAEKDIKGAVRGRWAVEGLQLPRLPSSKSDELPPWAVHIADARDEIGELKEGYFEDDEFSARVAASLWDIVFGLQVAAWAATDPDNYHSWKAGEKAQGVLTSASGNIVGANHWLQLDRLIRRQPEFRGQKDLEIYQVRPAMFALRNLSSDD